MDNSDIIFVLGIVRGSLEIFKLISEIVKTSTHEKERCSRPKNHRS